MADGSGLMRGKRGLIMGVANNRSIAWGIARACHAHGADLAFTYQGDALKKRVEPLAEEVDGIIVGHCDVSEPATIDAAFAELELVENLMSIYRPHSQLSQLNREGRLDDPHRYLLELLRYARDLSEQTDGAFDVTVQPVWSVYQSAARRGELPRERDLAAARAKVDWRNLEIAPRRLVLKRGAQITLNGIAQGFAADCAVRALRCHGVEHALVDTGELGALGRNGNGEAWTIGIQHPRMPEAYVSLAELEGRFLATSGDYATTFTSDFRHHHLLDPRTGRSPEELASVTIRRLRSKTA